MSFIIGIAPHAVQNMILLYYPVRPESVNIAEQSYRRKYQWSRDRPEDSWENPNDIPVYIRRIRVNTCGSDKYKIFLGAKYNHYSSDKK